MRSQYPVLSAVNTAMVAKLENTQQNNQALYQEISKGFGKIQNSISQLGEQIAEDPSRAMALDDVRQGTLAQMKVNPDKPDSDQARAIAQYLQNQKLQKLGGDVLAGGLSVGTVIGSIMAPGAAWPFWLGAAATGASVATGVRDYNESVTIDLAAQAQQGGAGNLTSKDKDEARFDLMMGQTNLLLAGLDAGLTAKATTGLLKSSAKTAAAFSKIKPAQLAQVMKEVSAGNIEKARSVLRMVGQVSDEVADEIVRSLGGLRGERLALEGVPGEVEGAIDPKQPMRSQGMSDERNELPKSQVKGEQEGKNNVKIAKTEQATAQEVRARRRVAEDFYQKHGFDADRARSHIKGIDFNKPVEVVQLKKGTVVEQWQVPGGLQGNYYAPVGSPPGSLGISPQAVSRQTGEIIDRTAIRYVLQEDVEVLRSTASEVTDTWSIPGRAVEAEGGGTQFFSTHKESFKGVE
jgi:hypothetical protein